VRTRSVRNASTVRTRSVSNISTVRNKTSKKYYYSKNEAVRNTSIVRTSEASKKYKYSKNGVGKRYRYS
jgi:hypothetical protein